MAEWDSVLGRSLENRESSPNDIDLNATCSTIIGSVHHVMVPEEPQQRPSSTNPREGSADSMRTVYSNSVNMPFTALVEIDNCDSSTVSSLSRPGSSTVPPVPANAFFSDTPSTTATVSKVTSRSPSAELNSLNRSIRLESVLQSSASTSVSK